MSTDPLIGTTLDSYVVVDLVGLGGMGVVYRARHPDRGEVALKVMAPELTRSSEFRERFVRESQLGIVHPHIIPIYDAGEANGQLYMAMYLVRGSDLKSLIRREGRLLPSRILVTFKQAADALDAAHAEGLVHRDIKPQNFLIEPREAGEDDHLYLSDFGLVKRVTSGTSLTGSAHLVGTAHYMSPEQIRGKELDGRADVYSLGCVLYESLTGVVPFQAEEEVSVLWSHVNDPPPLVSEKMPVLPSALDDVVGKAMAKDPDERHLTAGDLAADLENALGLSGKTDRPEWASFEISPSKRRPEAASAPPVDLYNSRSTIGWLAGVAGTLFALVVWLFSGDEAPLEKVQQLPALLGLEVSASPESVSERSPEGGARNARMSTQRNRRAPNRGSGGEPGSEAHGIATEGSDGEARVASDDGDASEDQSVAPHPASGSYVFAASGNQQRCSEGGGCLNSWAVPKRHEMQVAQFGLSNEPLIQATTNVSQRLTIKGRFEFAYEEVRLEDLVVSVSLEDEYGGDRSVRITPQPVVDWLVYPLAAGKSWSGAWSSSPDGSYSVDVRGREVVRVAGRDIDASVVDTTVVWSGPNEGRLEVRLWIDPRTRQVIASSSELDLRIAQVPNEMRFIAAYRAELVSGPGYGG